MAKFSLSFDALIEAPTSADAETQRQAMQDALANPALKMMLASLGIKLVGYRVSREIKQMK